MPLRFYSLWIGLLYSVFFCPSTWPSSQQKAERFRVVTLTADQLGAVSGQDLQRYSLITAAGNETHPIPFQIDEMNQEGFPYVADIGVPHSGQAGVLDGLDEVLFLLDDATTQPWNDQIVLPEGASLLAEVSMDTASGTRYAYLVQDDPRRSHEHYVHYESDTHFAESSLYTLAARLDNPLEWSDMTFSAYEGPEKESLIDTVKLRITGNAFGGMSTLTITNRNLKARVMGVLEGGIRSNVQIETTITIVKLPVMRLWVLYQFEPSHIKVISRAKSPDWVSTFFKKPSVSISVDANGLYGSQVYTALGENTAGLVDGKLSQTELLLQEHGVNDQSSWWLLKSPDNFQVLAMLKVPDTFATPVSLIYQDDARLRVRPERFIGQTPNIGFRVDNLPPGAVYTMAFDLFLDTSKPDYDLAGYVEHLRKPVKVRVRLIH